MQTRWVSEESLKDPDFGVDNAIKIRKWKTRLCIHSFLIQLFLESLCTAASVATSKLRNETGLEVASWFLPMRQCASTLFPPHTKNPTVTMFVLKSVALLSHKTGMTIAWESFPWGRLNSWFWWFIVDKAKWRALAPSAVILLDHGFSPTSFWVPVFFFSEPATKYSLAGRMMKDKWQMRGVWKKGKDPLNWETEGSSRR